MAAAACMTALLKQGRIGVLYASYCTRNVLLLHTGWYPCNGVPKLIIFSLISPTTETAVVPGLELETGIIWSWEMFSFRPFNNF